MRTNLSENDFYFIHWEEGSGEPEQFELIIDGKSKSHCMQIKQQILENQEYRKEFEHYVTKQFLEEEFEAVSITKKQFDKLKKNAEKFDLIKDESLTLNLNLLEENKQLKKDIENRKKVANLLQHDNSELREKLKSLKRSYELHLSCYKDTLERGSLSESKEKIQTKYYKIQETLKELQEILGEQKK